MVSRVKPGCRQARGKISSCLSQRLLVDKRRQKKEPVVQKDHSNHWRVAVPTPFASSVKYLIDINLPH